MAQRGSLSAGIETWSLRLAKMSHRVRLCAFDCADGLGKLNALRAGVESELTRVMISRNRQKTKPMVKRTAMMNDWSAMPRADLVVGKPRGTVCNCGSRGVLRFPERCCADAARKKDRVYSVQDDEQIGYSGRVDGRTTGRSKWTTEAGQESGA